MKKSYKGVRQKATVAFKKLHPKAQLPEYMTDNAAGADIRACLDSPVWIPPGDHVLITTGFAMELPVGYEAQIRPRSGLAFKYGLTVLNAPGTIDSDYRGPVGVIIINHGQFSVLIKHGRRIAQMVIAKVADVTMEWTEDLDDTDRGDGGFGHTGE